MHQIKTEIYHYFERLFEAPFWKGAFSIIAAILITLFGQFNQIAKYFLLAIALDVITGILKGILTRNFKSRYMRKSASKFISYGTAIIFAHFAEQFGAVGFRSFVISVLGFTELKSIGENLIEAKIKLPEFVLEEIDKYREKFKHFKMK